jgi:arylsulfatase
MSLISFPPSSKWQVFQNQRSWKNQKVPTAPGKSLVPAFASDVTIQRDNLWWFHDGHRAVRQGDFKLVSAKNQPWELYDLKTDRAESKNLVNQKPKAKRKTRKTLE